jgi:DNA topoisomerase-2
MALSQLKRRKGGSSQEDADALKRARGEAYIATLDQFLIRPASDNREVASPHGGIASSSSPGPSPRNRPGKNAKSKGEMPEALQLPPSAASQYGDKRAGRTVEETYQKKTQLEHILLRPDSYVGSTEKQSQEHWVFDESSGRMTRQKLEYVPALFKIFDEILVNAADNRVRSSTQDTIKVDIDAKKGCISVWNNGSGVPVQVHKEHNCYVPELIFGHLLTSDNYDDNERKVTGGRNGYGAKLTNIYSTRFIVETADSNSGKSYKQVWENNMMKRNEPEISPIKQGEDFTRITFFSRLPTLRNEGFREGYFSSHAPPCL